MAHGSREEVLASPVFKAAMAKFGQETAEEIARQIAAGEITVAGAVEKYDLQAWINVGARLDDYEERVQEGLVMAAEADAVVPIDGDCAGCGSHQRQLARGGGGHDDLHGAAPTKVVSSPRPSLAL